MISSRWFVVKISGTTSRPVVPPLGAASPSASISVALRTGAGFTCRPNAAAASSTGRRKIVPPLGVAAGPSLFDPQIAALNPAQPFQLLAQRVDPALRLGVGFRDAQQDRDSPHFLGVLGSTNARPGDSCQAAEKRKKLPPPHAINPCKV